MNNMKTIELFLKKLGILNFHTLNKVSSDIHFTNKIHETFDEMFESSQALLSDVPENKKSEYFTENIIAFSKSDEAATLFVALSSIFKIESKQLKGYVVNILNNNTNTQNFVENIFQMIEKNFSLTREEIIKIIEKNPKILGCNLKVYYNNLTVLSKKYKVKNTTLTYIFKNSPLYFAKNDLISSVYMISKMLSLSSLELDYLMLNSYNLLLSPILSLRENISSLINIFQLDDCDVISLIKTKPEILLIPKSSLYNFAKIVMRAFSCPESKLEKIICMCPNLLSLPQERLYSNSIKLLNFDIFVKKDLKEIMIEYPEILSIPPKYIANRVIKLSKLFSLSSAKNVTDIIRISPSILSINNLEEKIKKLTSYAIPENYIKIAPNILSSNSLTAAIKFSMLAPFNLEYELDNVINQPIKLINSKLKYLSINNGDYKDVTLSNKLFESKYKISYEDLLSNYQSSNESIIELIKLTKNKYNESDILYNKLKDFITADYLYEIKLFLSEDNNNLSQRNNKYKIKKILILLGLDFQDAESISSLLSPTVLSTNILAIISMLHALGFSRDEIILIIKRKPIILASNPKKLKEKYIDLKNEFSISNTILCDII